MSFTAMDGWRPAMVIVPIRANTPQQVSHAVITAAMTVHTELSPGLLESTYTACVRYELKQAGFDALAQVALPVAYRGGKVDLGYRMDLRVGAWGGGGARPAAASPRFTGPS